MTTAVQPIMGMGAPVNNQIFFKAQDPIFNEDGLIPCSGSLEVDIHIANAWVVTACQRIGVLPSELHGS